MSKIKDGGAAFPIAGLSGLPNDNFIYPQAGMTLRDYFAAAALQGLAVNAHNFDNMSDKSIAENAYLIADAMIEARKGTQP